MNAYANPYDTPERQIDPDCAAPRFFAVAGVNLHCLLCDASHALAISAGCGEDAWWCSNPCKHAGEHIAREEHVCLHGVVQVIS